MSTRGNTGRGSAGPRGRTLDEAEVRARREALLRRPPSPERSRSLATVRHQLQAIARRVDSGACA